jgi:stage II sporulation protein AA (anti-sigma F factor antagonist)
MEIPAAGQHDAADAARRAARRPHGSPGGPRVQQASRTHREVCSLCLSYSEEFVMSNVMDGTNRFGFLELRSERCDDEHVIALIGELDLDGAERVTRELLRAEASDARRIVLDLSNLRFIDSTGIRLILAADARSRRDGDRLALIRGPRAVHRVFELSGIAERLPFAG